LKRWDKKNNDPARKAATSWPIGDDAYKSAAKFRASYMVDDAGRGPLRDLGLAQVVNGKLLLTKEGLELSKMPSPILGETREGSLVGPEARHCLADALLANVKEREILNVFLRPFSGGETTQEALDDALIEAYGWASPFTASQRLAVVGRLRDLELLTLSGRG